MPTSDETKHRIVRSHLDSNKDKYLSLLEDLRNYFKFYGQSREGYGKIYRIYSRAEKQGGQEFKEVWKIAGKLSDNSSVFDVCDIVGLTIVCPFTADLETVNARIRTDLKKKYDIQDVFTHKSAYQAVHYIIRRKKENDYKCEIQLKTAFHDSWALKAHDLTYKPPGSVDNRYASHMETLSAILTALERQTDIIKSMIDEAVYSDKKKKDAARRELMNKITDDIEGISDTIHVERLEELRKTVLDNKEKYKTEDIESRVFNNFQKMANKIGDKYGYERNLCRIIAAVVVSRRTNDCLDFAIAAISRWKESFKPTIPYPGPCPYHFSSLVLYACGEIERAISDVDFSLEMRRANKGEGKEGDLPLAITLGSAAHYYAELIGTTQRTYISMKDASERANKYISEALTLAPEFPPLWDTEGFIKIVLAETESEVEYGLYRCRACWERYRDTPIEKVSDLFYSIHKRLAYRRILSLGSDV